MITKIEEWEQWYAVERAQSARNSYYDPQVGVGWWIALMQIMVR